MNLPIAVFISGGGTTLKNLIQCKQEEGLPADFRLVISSRADAGGIAHAQQADISTQVVRKQEFSDPQAYSEAMFQPCREAQAKIVVMAGFLKHVLIPEDFENRVVNIHPGLIPAFCGKGMYGRNVHQAVLDYGAKISGCTVHFVDNQYDHGPIILQKTCPVQHDDDAAALAARVFQQECVALPEVLRAMAEQRVEVHGRHVIVRESRQ